MTDWKIHTDLSWEKPSVWHEPNISWIGIAHKTEASSKKNNYCTIVYSIRKSSRKAASQRYIQASGRVRRVKFREIAVSGRKVNRCSGCACSSLPLDNPTSGQPIAQYTYRHHHQAHGLQYKHSEERPTWMNWRLRSAVSAHAYKRADLSTIAQLFVAYIYTRALGIIYPARCSRRDEKISTLSAQTVSALWEFYRTYNIVPIGILEPIIKYDQSL